MIGESVLKLRYYLVTMNRLCNLPSIFVICTYLTNKKVSSNN